MLDDKRNTKMCLETAQMLFTALYSTRSDIFTVVEYCPLKSVLEGKKGVIKKAYYINGIRVYAPTHANHPCNKWVRESRENYVWTLIHFETLLDEFNARRGKDHSAIKFINIFNNYMNIFPLKGLTDFVNCAANKSLGISYKHVENVTEAYQLYLMDRWSKDKLTPKWYGKEVPKDLIYLQ